jgi:dTDP-4-amino-4,6-dideoxygalactose transaminase
MGVGADVHYPLPDHRQPVFGERYAALRLAHTEQLAGEVLTLPCYPEMSDAQVDQVCAAVNAWPGA